MFLKTSARWNENQISAEVTVRHTSRNNFTYRGCLAETKKLSYQLTIKSSNHDYRNYAEVGAFHPPRVPLLTTKPCTMNYPMN